MDSIEFELHGIGAQILGDQPELLASLKRDFMGFPANRSDARIKVVITDRIPWSNEGQKLLTVWKSRKVTTKGWWNRRVNIYPSVRAESVTKCGTRYLWIEGESQSAMREVIYKFVLSALGEELELRGYHRVHGCGFEKDGKRFLVFGRSGVGKSSLAAQFVSRSFPLFSDESPLIKGRSIFGFPTRLSLDARAAVRLGISGFEVLQRDSLTDKVLVSYPLPVPGGGNLHRVYLAETSAVASIGFAGFVSKLAFVFSTVFGLGLAQMAEWMLRGSALPRLCVIFFRRLFVFTRLFFSAQFSKITLTPDPRVNLQALRATIDHQDDHSFLNSVNLSN